MATPFTVTFRSDRGLHIYGHPMADPGRDVPSHRQRLSNLAFAEQGRQMPRPRAQAVQKAIGLSWLFLLNAFLNEFSIEHIEPQFSGLGTIAFAENELESGV
jgi:hypothetical protein